MALLLIFNVYKTFYFCGSSKQSVLSNYYNRAFACDVMAAMLVFLDKRILNIFF